MLIRHSVQGGNFTDCGESRNYRDCSVESNNEVKMTKQEIIEIIHRAGFEAIERETAYNREEKLGV